MNTLQPKHLKISEKEATEFLNKLNISKSQLPKILSSDPALPEGSAIGDLIKVERKEEDGKINAYFRVVI
jgi:DNA-directed RNA polymerase subunit H